MTEQPADAALAPYGELLAIAEEQSDLIRRGELEALGALWPAWDRLAAGLPPNPPPGALPLLRRLAAVSDGIEAQLDSRRQGLMRELSGTARARRAAHGYAQPRRRPLGIDRSI